MTKFKRELVPGSYLTAADMLSVLSQQQLRAAAVEGQVVLLVEAPVAWLLDCCCVGRTAAQATGGAVPVINSTSSSGGGSGSGNGIRVCDGMSGSAALLAASVQQLAGVNRASRELWEQYKQHQQQLLAQQARKGSKARRAPATTPAATGAVSGGGCGEPAEPEAAALCLVYLSFQEAVFLNSVLHCTQVAAAPCCCEQPCQQQHQHQQDGEQQQQQQQPAECVDRNRQAAEQQMQHTRQMPQHQGEEWQAATLTPAAAIKSAAAAGDEPGAAVLSNCELWRWCCRHTTGGSCVFAPQYAAYHHLRCLGWLPLPGLPYGGDYVLYPLHPELSHSDFVVIVMAEADAAGADSCPAMTAAAAAAAAPVRQTTSEAGCMQATDAAGQETASALEAAPVEVAASGALQQGGVDRCRPSSSTGSELQPTEQPLAAVEPLTTAEQDGGLQQRPRTTQLAWLDACISHRLARQVLKELLLLYVVVPAGVSLLEFECIHRMQVREVLVQRWVPSEHREG